jgi:DUF438 domain-containing protein
MIERETMKTDQQIEIQKLKNVILEVFSYDKSMRDEGCDTIGHSMLPLSKESRLIIIETLRDKKVNLCAKCQDKHQNKQLKAELIKANSLIQEIDKTLRVPAAEFVPAIGDVFALIDKAKKL